MEGEERGRERERRRERGRDGQSSSVQPSSSILSVMRPYQDQGMRRRKRPYMGGWTEFFLWVSFSTFPWNTLSLCCVSSWYVVPLVPSFAKMSLKELSSLEKALGLKKPNKYSTQGDRKVPVLQTINGPALVGLVTIATHLVQEAKRPELLGGSAEHKAVVQQWLEYRVTKVDGCHKEDIKTILKDLNSYLEDKVYLAGNQFTLADTLMYYGIHHVIVDLAVQEKEKYMNMTRWFDHVQHYPSVRHHLPPVVVLRNRVYTSGHH